MSAIKTLNKYNQLLAEVQEIRQEVSAFVEKCEVSSDTYCNANTVVIVKKAGCADDGSSFYDVTCDDTTFTDVESDNLNILLFTLLNNI